MNNYNPTLPVDDVEFWRDRLYRVISTGAELHTVVYNCHPDVWRNIQNSHYGVLRRFIKDGMKVLDAGCGYGALYDVMPPGVSYTGIDFSPELVRIAKTRHPDADFVVGNLNADLQRFPASYFDIGICRSIDDTVLNNLGQRQWEHIEGEIGRVCRRFVVLSYENPEVYFLPSARPTGNVAVACIPRTGSTMLWRAIAGLQPGSHTPPGFFGPNSPINVRKLTHYTDDLPADTKAIFLFGKVPYSIVSTRRAIYDRTHFRHCGYEGEDAPDIYSADALNYEGIFDGWVNNKRYQTLCVRYEKLFEHVDEIRSFLDLDELTLPPFRQRATNPTEHVDQAELSLIMKTYESLILKTRAMPDVKVLNRERGN